MKSKIIIIAGPSGVGKGTIKKYLLKDSDFEIIKTITTRPPKKRDSIHNDRVYITKDEFLKLDNENRFVETNFYNNHYYGTLKSDTDLILRNNKIGILEEDIVHAYVTKKFYPKDCLIFFIDSSIDDIKKRLIERNENTKEEVEERLNIAKHELDKKHLADYIIDNPEGHPEIAADKIKQIITQNCKNTLS